MVERFPACRRVHFLGIIGAGADDVVRMMRRVNDDRPDFLNIIDLRAHPKCQVDQRLRLVLGRVLLRIRLEDRAFGLTGRG